jgi:hypothetical protein
MTRCVLALMAALVIASPAQAQRVFERDALRGELVVTTPPLALLNGKPARLAPGARIRNAQNLLQLTGGILDQKLLVHYTVDGFGQVQNVWILTEAEAAKRPWPTTAQEAATWSFDPTRQVWVKP